MFSIQSKINRNLKKQENVTHTLEKNSKIETDTEMLEIMELAGP